MPANAKTIKRRIKSIGNTKKITKAMELVAASKMRRSMSAVLGTRPFAHTAWDTVKVITRVLKEDVSHPLLEQPEEAQTSLVLLFTSDRGLAGAFNASIIKKAIRQMREIDGDVQAISIGRRGNSALAREDIPVLASFEGLTNKPNHESIAPIAKMVMDAYQEKKYKAVYIAYTDFKSALSQEPQWMQLLPFTAPEEELGSVGQGETKAEEEAKDEEYIFEPSPQAVLDRMLPRLIETMIFQALLESSASEHAARMMAMRSATDNASDMLGELKMTYNRVRQAGITQEISEISAGKAALE